MVNPFKKPFREVETPGDKVTTILLFGLFIFLFLFLFKPFGLSQLKEVQQFLLTLGFGLVTSAVLVIFTYLLEPLIIRSDWTFGKSILLDLLIASSIGVANYFYVRIVFPDVFVIKYLFTFVWTAILVGIIPVTIRYIIVSNKKFKKALKEAAILPDEILWENEILIQAGNPRNEHKFNPKNIVYLTSNDNYVTIVTNKGGTILKTHLRGTLKAAESELKNNSGFIRCHKCFIVNSYMSTKLQVICRI